MTLAAARLSVDAKSILPPSRDRRLVRARDLFSYWAVRELGETGVAVARFLGLTPPAVSQAVLRGKRIAEEGCRLQDT